MTPVARDYLAKAHEDVDEGSKTLAIGLDKIAARAAYFAAFHAAEALIHERLGKIVKTHAGVHAEFARCLRSLPDSGRPYLVFLSHAYRFKELSDYVIGERSVIVREDAEMALAEATALVEQIAQWLAA